MIYLDLETTGLLLPPQADPVRQPRIVQAAWAEDDGPIEVRLVNPGVPIPEEASRIHGIRNADVHGAMLEADFLAFALLPALAFKEVCAYNAAFDLTVILHACRRHGLSPTWSGVVDPMSEAEDRFGRRLKLADLHERLTGRKPARSHDAGADVESLRAVHRRLLELPS